MILKRRWQSDLWKCRSCLHRGGYNSSNKETVSVTVTADDTDDVRDDLIIATRERLLKEEDSTR